jgi:hypothetical protein
MCRLLGVLVRGIRWGEREGEGTNRVQGKSSGFQSL